MTTIGSLPAAPAPPTGTMSVGELAVRSRTSVRTIRYYQSEGLLPPPGRAGRSARYGQAHLERLETVARLRRRGLRLSAIAELLRQGEGATVEDWAGLGAVLSRPWSADRPELLGETELAERIAPAPPEILPELERAGLVEHRVDTTPAVYLVPSPGMLDIALALVGLGIDLRTGDRLRRLLHERLRDLATELVARFTEEVSVDHLAASGPGGLAELLDALQPLTRRTVDLLFAHEMERAQHELLEAAAPVDAPQPPSDGTSGRTRGRARRS